MSKVAKINVEYKDGSVYTIANDKDIRAILSALLEIKPTYTKTAPISVLRNKYFGMINDLHKYASTGYTKAELHEYLKPILFGKFADFKHYFKTGVPEYSTQALNIEGWSALIEQLQSTAGDIFGFVFKDK